jgi:polyisoprenoid-binding protein YceI
MTATRWTFEPGHTAAEFQAKHMMVTWVRGQFKNVHGTCELDFEHPEKSHCEAVIDVDQLWTGVPERDAHLRTADFFDLANHPQMHFLSTAVEQTGATDFRVTGDLTIRGTTRPVSLDVGYLGQWQTSWWVDGVDEGPRQRAGFVVHTRLNRHDFGVSWNDRLDHGGVVVGNEVKVVVDVEAVLDD